MTDLAAPGPERRNGRAWIVLALAVAACSPSVQRLEVLSDVYTIDRIYRSMQGPSATVDVTIPSAAPELVWITGYRADVVGPNGTTRLPPEFMCHSNLGLADVRRHARLFGWTKLPAHRLFTVSQGQAELHFPSGFGIPLLTNETLTLTTQVLNHNLPDPHDPALHEVRQRPRAGRRARWPLRGTGGW